MGLAAIAVGVKAHLTHTPVSTGGSTPAPRETGRPGEIVTIGPGDWIGEQSTAAAAMWVPIGVGAVLLVGSLVLWAHRAASRHPAAGPPSDRDPERAER